MSAEKDEWFCNARWDEKEKEIFEKRLSKSRSKAPFIMRAKGAYLWRTREPSLVKEAITIFERAIEKYPDSDMLSSLLLQCALCYELLGDREKAAAAFRQTIAVEKDPSGFVRETTAWSSFALFAVRHRLYDIYDEIFEIARNARTFLVYQEFVKSAVCAIVYNYRGEKEDAVKEKDKALAVLNATDSGLPGRPELGLVDREQYSDIIELLNSV